MKKLSVLSVNCECILECTYVGTKYRDFWNKMTTYYSLKGLTFWGREMLLFLMKIIVTYG